MTRLPALITRPPPLTGERLTEGIKINLSLTALGNVISALVDGKSGACSACAYAASNACCCSHGNR